MLLTGVAKNIEVGSTLHDSVIQEKNRINNQKKEADIGSAGAMIGPDEVISLCMDTSVEYVVCFTLHPQVRLGCIGASVDG